MEPYFSSFDNCHHYSDDHPSVIISDEELQMIRMAAYVNSQDVCFEDAPNFLPGPETSAFIDRMVTAYNANRDREDLGPECLIEQLTNGKDEGCPLFWNHEPRENAYDEIHEDVEHFHFDQLDTENIDTLSRAFLEVIDTKQKEESYLVIPYSKDIAQWTTDHEVVFLDHVGSEKIELVDNHSIFDISRVMQKSEGAFWSKILSMKNLKIFCGPIFQTMDFMPHIATRFLSEVMRLANTIIAYYCEPITSLQNPFSQHSLIELSFEKQTYDKAHFTIHGHGFHCGSLVPYLDMRSAFGTWDLDLDYCDLKGKISRSYSIYHIIVKTKAARQRQMDCTDVILKEPSPYLSATGTFVASGKADKPEFQATFTPGSLPLYYSNPTGRWRYTPAIDGVFFTMTFSDLASSDFGHSVIATITSSSGDYLKVQYRVRKDPRVKPLYIGTYLGIIRADGVKILFDYVSPFPSTPQFRDDFVLKVATRFNFAYLNWRYLDYHNYKGLYQPPFEPVRDLWIFPHNSVKYDYLVVSTLKTVVMRKTDILVDYPFLISELSHVHKDCTYSVDLYSTTPVIRQAVNPVPSSKLYISQMKEHHGLVEFGQTFYPIWHRYKSATLVGFPDNLEDISNTYFFRCVLASTYPLRLNLKCSKEEYRKILKFRWYLRYHTTLHHVPRVAPLDLMMDFGSNHGEFGE